MDLDVHIVVVDLDDHIHTAFRVLVVEQVERLDSSTDGGAKQKNRSIEVAARAAGVPCLRLLEKRSFGAGHGHVDNRGASAIL